jgi:uncharacterized membrane protein HdeD (DUF308 family)
MNALEGFDTRRLVDIADDVLSLWWLWLVKGVLAVIFGVVAWAYPDLTLTALIWIVGLYLIGDGIMNFVGLFMFREVSWGRRLLLAVWGIAQIVAGVIVIAAPDVGVITLMVVFGVWLLATGIFLVVSALTSDGHLMSPWLQALTGILGAIVGVYLVVEPGRGAVASVWVLGVMAIAYGLIQIYAGFRMRSLRDTLGTRLATG